MQSRSEPVRYVISHDLVNDTEHGIKQVEYLKRSLVSYSKNNFSLRYDALLVDSNLIIFK